LDNNYCDVKLEEKIFHPHSNNQTHCLDEPLSHRATISPNDHQSIQPSNGRREFGRKNAAEFVDLRHLAENGRSNSDDVINDDVGGAVRRKSFSRKNAWGGRSYADLISDAIESSSSKRLTLAEIYEWIIKNVEYFGDKTDSTTSAGWKNSIRHNLSLHSRFVRVVNETAGKSSWWTIRDDVSNRQYTRRRSYTMDSVMGRPDKMKGRRKEPLRYDHLQQHHALAFHNDSPNSLPRNLTYSTSDDVLPANHLPVITRSPCEINVQQQVAYKDKIIDHGLITDSTSEIIGNNLFPSDQFEAGDSCSDYTEADYRCRNGDATRYSDRQADYQGLHDGHSPEGSMDMRQTMPGCRGNERSCPIIMNGNSLLY